MLRLAAKPFGKQFAGLYDVLLYSVDRWQVLSHIAHETFVRHDAVVNFHLKSAEHNGNEPGDEALAG
jgi:hypothetical protein